LLSSSPEHDANRSPVAIMARIFFICYVLLIVLLKLQTIKNSIAAYLKSGTLTLAIPLLDKKTVENVENH
jgi:hypothetical protein